MNKKALVKAILGLKQACVCITLAPYNTIVKGVADEGSD